MHDFTGLVDRYIAMWNERDGGRRRDLIAAIWRQDQNVDPLLRGAGHSGIEAIEEGVQARIRFAWAPAPEGGEATDKGVEFCIVSGNRLRQITGFIDPTPTSN